MLPEAKSVIIDITSILFRNQVTKEKTFYQYIKNFSGILYENSTYVTLYHHIGWKYNW